jgi:hypothetical protein
VQPQQPLSLPAQPHGQQQPQPQQELSDEDEDRLVQATLSGGDAATSVGGNAEDDALLLDDSPSGHLDESLSGSGVSGSGGGSGAAGVPEVQGSFEGAFFDQQMQQQQRPFSQQRRSSAEGSAGAAADPQQQTAPNAVGGRAATFFGGLGLHINAPAFNHEPPLPPFQDAQQQQMQQQQQHHSPNAAFGVGLHHPLMFPRSAEPQSPQDILLAEQVQAQLDGYGARPLTPPLGHAFSVTGGGEHADEERQQANLMRARVNAASLRPFTPNVVPVSSADSASPPITPMHRPLQALAGGTRGGRGGALAKAKVLSSSSRATRLGNGRVLVAGSGSGMSANNKVALKKQPQASNASSKQQQSQQQQQQHQPPALQSPPPAHVIAPGPVPPADDEVSLVYDAVLKCYFDPVTNIYYELA